MQAYLELLKDILANGEEHHDRTGVGTLSVFGRQVRFNLRGEFPLMTTKKLPLRWIFEELRWFLSGSTDEAVLRAAGVDIWKEWATAEQCARFKREEGDLGPVYGFLWRHFGAYYSKKVTPYVCSPCSAGLCQTGGHCLDYGSDTPAYCKHNCVENSTPSAWTGHDLGTDQIARLIRQITETPNSRRLIVTGWDPGECDRVALPPCHTLWQMKVHEPEHDEDCKAGEGQTCICGAMGELSCMLTMRSADTFLGVPFNIASYALLTYMVAHVTGLNPRELIVSFGDVHVYKNHLDAVREQLSREPRPLPQLYIADPRKELRGLDGLLAMRWEHLHLEGYNPYPSIKAEVAV